MKFIRLEILNLASLDRREGEVIDFTQGALGQSNIFSIVGPTGSGKSTILDAICLALYNCAPRYPKKKKPYTTLGNEAAEKNKINPNDPRNILTRGKKTGYSKLTFLANNGKTYRAEWHVDFKIKQYGNARKYLFEITPQGETEAKWADLEQIIGLDFDQFLRTVLIAQGSFANFLNADEDNRYELLEKLVGCDEFYKQIVEEIKAKKDDAKTKLDEINALIGAQQQQILPDEELKQTVELIHELTELENALKQKIQDNRKAQEWFDTEQKIKGQIEIQDKNRELVVQQVNDYTPQEQRFLLHKELESAISMHNEEQRVSHEIERLECSIRAKKEEKTNIEQARRTAEEEASKLQGAYESAQTEAEAKTPDINAARESLALLKQGKEQLKEKETKCASAKVDLENAVKERDDNSANISLTTESIETASVKLSASITEQSEAIGEITQKIASQKEEIIIETKKIEGKDLKKLQQEQKIAEEYIQVANQLLDKQKLLRDTNTSLYEKKAKVQRNSERCDELSSELASLKVNELHAQKEELNNLITSLKSANLKALRAELREGKECPLCGSTDHPYCKSAIEVVENELDEQLRKVTADYDAAYKRSQQITKEVAKLEGETGELTKQINGFELQIVELKQHIAEIQQQHPAFISEEYVRDILPDLESRKQDAEKKVYDYTTTQGKLLTLNKKLEALTKQKEDIETDLNKKVQDAKDELDKLKGRLQESKAKAPQFEKSVSDKTEAHKKIQTECTEQQNLNEALKAKITSLIGDTTPDEFDARLKKAVYDAQRKLEKKRKEIADQVEKLAKTDGEITSQARLCDINKATLNKTKAQLDEWISRYNQREKRIVEINKEIVAEYAVATDDWATINKHIDTLRQNLSAADALVKQSKQELAEHQKNMPKQTLEELKAESEEIQNQSHMEQIADLMAHLKKHEDAIAAIGKRAEELRQLKKLNQDWKEIWEVIGSGGKDLRKVAQCYTLRFLIEHANAEISRFNNRYKLKQVKNSLGIRVIDHDRADDEREVTSLSGGETFIVSLGLALGLSALSSRNISFDNLFIDEGFGTLDPSSLAMVIDALATLQSSQNKKVGVISHTDTMSERITTQIRVHKNGNTGSSRIEIYP